MKYYYHINTQTSKEIQQRIKSEFPVEDGWKFYFKIDSGETFRVYVVSAPNSIFDSSVKYKEITSCGMNNDYARIRFIADGHELSVESQNYSHADLDYETDKQSWMTRIYQGSPDIPFKLSK